MSCRYRDAEGILRRDLLDAEAQDEAKALVQISTTQLRRFFEQVGAIKRRMEVDPSVSDGEILAQAAFLKASSYYAAARSRTNEAVKDFVIKHVDSIKARRDFLDFHRHFEAVVAFHRYFGKDEKGN
jgi:CRISPR-associated protein Csm2